MKVVFWWKLYIGESWLLMLHIDESCLLLEVFNWWELSFDESLNSQRSDGLWWTNLCPCDNNMFSICLHFCYKTFHLNRVSQNRFVFVISISLHIVERQNNYFQNRVESTLSSLEQEEWWSLFAWTRTISQL